MTVHEHPTVIFDSDDSEFVRGVTIGSLYGVFVARPDLDFTFTLDRANVENLLRIVEATRRHFHALGTGCDSGCHLDFQVDRVMASRR